MAPKLRPLAATLVVGLTATTISLSTGQAQAQTLFDLIFGNLTGPSPSYNRIPTRIKIKAPRYYAYKAERFSRVGFRDLADRLAAGTVDELDPELQETRFAKAHELIAAIRLRTYREVGSAITKHYAKRPEFIWVSEDGVNERARTVLAAMASANKVGLVAEDYRLDSALRNLTDADGASELEEQVGFELALSAKVLLYALDATRGRVDPNKISGYHDLKRNEVDLVAVLGRLAESDDAGEELQRLNPGSAQFKALVEELATLRREAEEQPPIRIAPGTFLRPGGSSGQLVNIVAAIRQRGSDDLKAAHAETLEQYTDGAAYTDEVVALVRAFQKENGLKADGIVGRRTIRAMVPVGREDREERVVLAMERLRWLPHDLGARHVFVNQPAYVVRYVDEGEERLKMRVIIGKKSNQTSFFRDKIETVEYNPYWGVPLSIVVNEMMPKLSRDPNYLDRTGYEVTTHSGRRVSSSQVNWGAVATKKSFVAVRQPPGPRNALGAVKILFPNKHAIYMHDTPNKALFRQDRRAFSHGCIRLERPRTMAAAVLGQSKDYVDGRINGGSNNREDLEQTMPVYVSYFTAWPNAENEVEYFDDVYDRDSYLTQALQQVESARQEAG